MIVFISFAFLIAQLIETPCTQLPLSARLALAQAALVDEVLQLLDAQNAWNTRNSAMIDTRKVQEARKQNMESRLHPWKTIDNTSASFSKQLPCVFQFPKAGHRTVLVSARAEPETWGMAYRAWRPGRGRRFRSAGPSKHVLWHVLRQTCISIHLGQA